MTRPSRPPARFPLGLDQVHASAVPRAVARPVSAPVADTMLRPQRPLQQAADDALRRHAPSGLGMDSAAVRARMVERLRASGVRCEPVLQAFAGVERHGFVDTALATQAYEDTSLPIGLQQTISKPSVVACMLALLFEGAHARAQGQLGRVLEIGTGCGYQTALLARLGRSVVSIERLKALHERARENLAAHRQGDIRLVFGDGRLGHAPRAPYHSIISAAGGEDLPAAWLDQLAEGGRLIAPSTHPVRGGQALLVVDRDAQGLNRRWHDAVHFVPLKSGTQ
jgi:protein-L-isoaspartate(D-aspartate) O-methyltransferase